MAEKDDLLKSLSLAPSILAGFISSIPADKLDQRRGDGFWTIKEHLAHVVETQTMLGERLTRFANEIRPVFVPHFPADDEGTRLPINLLPDDLLGLYAERREAQVATIRTYRPEVWNRRAEHPEYSEYSALILVRHIFAHDMWHLYRMEDLWLTRAEYLQP